MCEMRSNDDGRGGNRKWRMYSGIIRGEGVGGTEGRGRSRKSDANLCVMPTPRGFL
jgi:hypothetical protein